MPNFFRNINAPHASALLPVAGPSPAKILQMGFAFWGSKVLLSAVELGLFTELARRPGTLDQLNTRINLHPRSARDFLDALVSLGFLARENGMYSNTPDTDLFLDREKPSYIGGILEMSNARLYPFWGSLTEALHTGVPQNEAKSGAPDIFAELYADPQRLKQFLQAMTGVSRGANLAITQNFPWGKYQTFVDAGTAQGDLAGQIALANPHLRGIGFDLPKVAPIFEEYAAKLGVSQWLSFAAGDFFQQPLPKADVILMGHILHDWDLAQKKHLIRAAWDALPTGGPSLFTIRLSTMIAAPIASGFS